MTSKSGYSPVVTADDGSAIGMPKAYGAGILSSLGELDVFQNASIRPLDFQELGSEEYDITRYQPVLYSLGSMDELHDRLLELP